MSNVTSERLIYLDLQDSTYASNTKFEAVGIVSCAISYLGISEESSLLGVKLGALPEPLIQTVFAAAAIALFVNYNLRLKDEGKIIGRLHEQLEALKKRAQGETEQLTEQMQKWENTFSSKRLATDFENAATYSTMIEAYDLEKAVKSGLADIAVSRKAAQRAIRERNMPIELDPNGLASTEASVYESKAQTHLEQAVGELAKIKSVRLHVDDQLSLLKTLKSNIEDEFARFEELRATIPNIRSFQSEIYNKISQLRATLVELDTRPVNAERRIFWYQVVWPRVLLFLIVALYVFALLEWQSLVSPSDIWKASSG